MPLITGLDWAGIADEIRAGNLVLDRSHRLVLCRTLAELIQAIEASGCSHRDIASGNILIDLNSWSIFLIDFDSLYHPTLQMPPGTTCGTAGYAPPFGWQNDNLDPGATWRLHADRFALAVLCVEFLVLEKDGPMTHEGGIFDQDDLKRGQRQVHLVRLGQASGELPQAAPLFDAAIRSSCFEDCPTPDAWITLWKTGGATVTPSPRLDDLRHLVPTGSSVIWPSDGLLHHLACASPGRYAAGDVGHAQYPGCSRLHPGRPMEVLAGNPNHDHPHKHPGCAAAVLIGMGDRHLRLPGLPSTAVGKIPWSRRGIQGLQAITDPLPLATGRMLNRRLTRPVKPWSCLDDR